MLARTSVAGLEFTNQLRNMYEDEGEEYVPDEPVPDEADDELDASITGVDNDKIEDLEQDGNADEESVPDLVQEEDANMPTSCRKRTWIQSPAKNHPQSCQKTKTQLTTM